MRFAKIVLALMVFLGALAGCESRPKEKSITEEQRERWHLARAGVQYSLAKEQYEAGNMDAARKTINGAFKYAPKNAQIRLLSAKVFIEQGQLEAAEAELNVLRELDARNAEADYLAGVINQRWQKLDAALQCYVRASQKNPNELAYLMAQSEMLVQLDQDARALQILKDKLNFFENNPFIRDAVGQLLVEEGKYEEAAGILRQANALAPEEQGIREHYGMALFYARQYREAATVLERLVNAKVEKREDGKERPSYADRADIHTAIGECKMETDRPREARDHFEVASQLQPQNVTVWLNLAKAALRLNDPRRAELSLKKAMSIDPKVADAHLMMGYLNLQNAEVKGQKSEIRTQKLSDALASFRKASSLDDRDAVSVAMQGLVLEKWGGPTRRCDTIRRR